MCVTGVSECSQHSLKAKWKEYICFWVGLRYNACPMKTYAKKIIKIATRQSKLALWQAEFVKSALEAIAPDLTIQLIKIITQGDQILDAPLAKIGGKGLFVKELEQVLLENKADLAVHSMKDVPAELPSGLMLPIILKRENPFDAWVSAYPFDALPPGSRVGTCSLRRKMQLKALRQDLEYLDLRGNVDTRLRKLDEGHFDGIVLAAAGLIRLGCENRMQSVFSEQHILPAVGQGAIGIECRQEDEATQRLLAPLACANTTACVLAERAMNAKLGGSCQIPIAGFAVEAGESLILEGRVGNLAGTTLLKTKIKGTFQDPISLGEAVAQKLCEQGALAIIDEIHQSL